MLLCEQQSANPVASCAGAAQPYLKWQSSPYTGARTITVEDRVFTLVPHFVRRKVRGHNLSRLHQHGWQVTRQVNGGATITISLAKTIAAAESLVNEYESGSE